MVGDLKQTVLDLGKALAKLLNIDPKSWSLKWDFSNFITQMGEFSKMLSMIGDLLNAIKDGRWSDAASIGKALLKQGSDQCPGVTSSAVNARGKVLGFWEEVKPASVMAAGISMSRTRLPIATITPAIFGP
jgi:hypothetical protein